MQQVPLRRRAENDFGGMAARSGFPSITYKRSAAKCRCRNDYRAPATKESLRVSGPGGTLPSYRTLNVGYSRHQTGRGVADYLLCAGRRRCREFVNLTKVDLRRESLLVQMVARHLLSRDYRGRFRELLASFGKLLDNFAGDQDPLKSS